jgi:hypothetical protein
MIDLSQLTFFRLQLETLAVLSQINVNNCDRFAAISPKRQTDTEPGAALVIGHSFPKTSPADSMINKPLKRRHGNAGRSEFAASSRVSPAPGDRQHFAGRRQYFLFGSRRQIDDLGQRIR